MALKPGDTYALYAEIDQFIGNARKKGVTKEQIREFIQDVKQRSQSAAPVGKTGKLKNSWYSHEIEDGVFVFGYSVDYAMPVDYNTSFFTNAVNIAIQKFGREWGVDATEILKDVKTSTLPGEYD